MRALRTDPHYQAQARAEARYWATPAFTAADLEDAQSPALRGFLNEGYTGRESTSWMADLIERGPFRRAAVLGSTLGVKEREWLDAGGSRQLDVYDISDPVLRRARRLLRTTRFGVPWPNRRVRCFEVDLNFVALPRGHYDVVWTSASLHHVLNLEYLLEEVHASLREGGLFAIHDYIGEPRLRYAPARMELANEVFRSVPRRFRRTDAVTPPPPEDTSPFEAIRSDEIPDLVRERFEVLHYREVEALFPIFLHLEVHQMEREEPSLLPVIFAAERAARQDPAVRNCSLYGVFGRRPGGAEATRARQAREA